MNKPAPNPFDESDLTTEQNIAIGLAKIGLVQKIKSPQDGRAIAVTLTAAGVQAAKKTMSWNDFLLSTVDELTKAERGIFLRSLTRTYSC